LWTAPQRALGTGQSFPDLCSEAELWIARQITEAVGWEQPPNWLLRDRDQVHGEKFVRRIRAMGIRGHLTTTRSPWQNGHCERTIGSIRRDCLDHVIVLGEWHLRSILQRYTTYYNQSRIHLSLDKDSPFGRPVQAIGSIAAREILGDLHHHYVRI